MDSTTLINQIAVNQAEKEVTANENFNAASPAMLYARNAVTSLGLTWGYIGGRYNSTAIANGTLSLTTATTNYMVANKTTGAVTVATTTTNWNDTANYARLYLVVAGASTVTSYEDHRQAIAAAGSGASLTANTFTGTQTFRAGGTGAATAPFKLQSGSFNTTPEVGAFEYLTDKITVVIETGAARKEITLNDAALTSGRVPFVA